MKLDKKYDTDYDDFRNLARALEKESLHHSRKEKISVVDMSAALPEHLIGRVKRIMEYEFESYDKSVFKDDSEVVIPIEVRKDSESSDAEERARRDRKKIFNESTCSEIERMEIDHPHFDMRIDAPLERVPKKKKKINWQSKFVCKKRKERVIWESRIYKMENSIWEKSLDDQAEQLMDTSAARFIEWLNALGSTQDDTNLTKDQLKNLFSIGGDQRLLASIKTDPKEVKAIAKTVADKWHLPDMAIELKYENYIAERLEEMHQEVIKVSFGETNAEKNLPWFPSSPSDLPIHTVYPEELLTYEKLFKGIGHLRSTKALVDFYMRRPEVPKPIFLEQSGMFTKSASKSSTLEIPLYELLKLHY